MMKKLLLSALLLCISSEARCEFPESLRRTLDSMICESLHEKAFPGASLAIA